MIENQDIAQGAVSKTKLSKNLRLDLTNLPKGTVGQIPIVQADGDWGLVNLSGDISIAADGATTVVNNATINAADIDTAFNFLTDQRGFVFRKGQQDYTVDDNNYATEIVAAAHADHAATTNASSNKFTIAITWASAQTGVAYSNGTGTGTPANGVATITHGLNTLYVLVSIIDVAGTSTASGTYGFVDLDAMALTKSVDDNRISIEWDLTSVPTGDEFLVTIMA